MNRGAASSPFALPAYVEPLDGGIHAIDTGFHRDRFDAAYLIVQDGRAAFVDTGTNLAVPRLLGALQALGLGVDAVDHVIATHVHLDHAGGVGLLMQQLPHATLVVHPRGARHMVDPRMLYQGALAVYGQAEMDRWYGKLQPVPAERVVTTTDGSSISLAGRELRFIDTPGHARHHHCLWDEASRGWFTGDTFGLSYREFDTPAGALIIPTTTPVQFEPDALARSYDRLLAADPQWMYLTHYGRVGGVPALGRQLHTLLAATVALGRRLQHHPDRHAALVAELAALYREHAAAHGCSQNAAEVDALLALDVELNAQGMAAWLDRPASA